MLALLLAAAAAQSASPQAPAAAGSAPVEFIGEPALAGRRLPFADAVRIGDMVYLSGAIGLRPDGTVPPGIEAQARLTMDTIGSVLQRQGLGFAHLVKCTIMLDDMNDWPAFNQIYVGYFPNGRFPARSAFGADGLALGALVEVECWAHAKAAGQ